MAITRNYWGQSKKAVDFNYWGQSKKAVDFDRFFTLTPIIL
jgi:hypothetical protein